MRFNNRNRKYPSVRSRAMRKFNNQDRQSFVCVAARCIALAGAPEAQGARSIAWLRTGEHSRLWLLHFIIAPGHALQAQRSAINRAATHRRTIPFLVGNFLNRAATHTKDRRSWSLRFMQCQRNFSECLAPIIAKLMREVEKVRNAGMD
jgi:hypothetical protein